MKNFEEKDNSIWIENIFLSEHNWFGNNQQFEDVDAEGITNDNIYPNLE
jgi:hypothetical protein